MLETRIGDFEEVMMLITGSLRKDESYAFRIAKAFESQTGRSVSLGAVHSTLDRLETKGFVRSELRVGTSDRGDRRKRIFTVTALGNRVLIDAMNFKVGLWKNYPAFVNKINFSV